MCCVDVVGWSNWCNFVCFESPVVEQEYPQLISGLCGIYVSSEEPAFPSV